MADLTDEEIAELRIGIRAGDFGDAGQDVVRLLDEVVRRRKREEAILSALDRIAPGTKRNVLAALECTE